VARRGEIEVTETRGPVWRQLSPALRTLGLWITIVQLVGYTTSLLFVQHTTGMTPPGVSAQYRGSDSTAVSDAAMKFPKSYSEMLLIAEPFVALLVSFSAMWLMRFVDSRFSLLLMLSSGLMAATFYVQSGFVLRELLSLEKSR
jgi:hypothetical protein